MSATPTAPSPLFAPPRITRSVTPGGSVVIRSEEPVAPTPLLADAFVRGAEKHPDRVLVGEKDGDNWRTYTWGRMRSEVERLAQGLLGRGLTGRPIMILSGASVDHLAVQLAGMTLGVPVVPVSVAYSLQTSDFDKLRSMAETVDPGVVFAQDADFAAASAAIADDRVLVSPGGVVDGSIPLSELGVEPTAEVGVRRAGIGPDTIAKILFTSGSTGKPKGVINTHGMLAANQQQMRQVWPFLEYEPPVLLDWLPWSHTFGGNHDLNMVLSNGGSMWIDDGRPAPGAIECTVRNLDTVRPTVYFNVPAGYAALLPILERDGEAAEKFLSHLRVGFFAAAALPQQLWERMERLAREHDSSMRMTTSWGMTETSPAATSTHFPIRQSNNIGVPLPGVEVKLAPVDGKTEMRLRGPNITPGFYGRSDLTADAFDEEGYLKTGDAVQLANAGDPALGLVFDGRIAEDFKLATGTFVSVGTLRPKLLSAAEGLLLDAVICGHDSDCVSALAWLHPDQRGQCSADGMPEPALRSQLEAALARLASTSTGSSQYVERLLLLTEDATLDAGEVTDKGYINQRKVRENRAQSVRRLLSTAPNERIITRPRL